MGVPAERGRGWCVLMFIWRSSGAPSRAVLLLSPPVCTNSNDSCGADVGGGSYLQPDLDLDPPERGRHVAARPFESIQFRCKLVPEGDD